MTDREERELNRLKGQAKLLPEAPGVYRFLNRDGTVIYVGKAKNLRRRVSSYFLSRHDHTNKVRLMVRQINDIEYIEVETEQDAFLLENSMIKSLQPRYNILLKDDKTYPWIVVTNEHFPQVVSTRRVMRDGSSYYGPYASVMLQRSILEFVHGIYQIRTCRLNLSPEAISRGKYSVCLQYHIGNCKGPCAGKQTEEDYGRTVELVKKILKGDLRPTKAWLEEQMLKAAAEMNFELAASYKSRLSLLDTYAAKSVLVSSTLHDLDVFSLYMDEDTAYCNFVRVVAGSVVNSFTIELSIGIDPAPETVLGAAVMQVESLLPGGLAKEIVVPFRPDMPRRDDLRFTVPSRGDKLKLLEFSRRNTRIYRLEKLKNLEIRNPEKHTERLMNAMQKELHMNVPPRHIECFDNSNFQGSYPVASCVVFRDGRPSKREYRHFNVKTVEGIDDFASMREIIGRRYSRLLAEGGELPDLIVVDGGKGQLSAACGVLSELGLQDRIKIVGLAKRIEEIYFPGDPNPYYLDRTGEPLKVMMNIRNEAHRFGITFHRDKRSADFIRTELLAIPGIGKTTADVLLRRFKSVKAVKEATYEQIAEAVGKARARIVFSHYHPGAGAPGNDMEPAEETDNS